MWPYRSKYCIAFMLITTIVFTVLAWFFCTLINNSMSALVRNCCKRLGLCMAYVKQKLQQRKTVQQCSSGKLHVVSVCHKPAPISRSISCTFSCLYSTTSKPNMSRNTLFIASISFSVPLRSLSFSSALKTVLQISTSLPRLRSMR